MESCVPKLTDATLDQLEKDAKEFALTTGIGCRSIDLPNDNCLQSLRFTLFPSPFPLKWCLLAQRIQQGINLMMHRISYDKQFLEESLADVIRVDSFTRSLYEIYLKVSQDVKASKLNLGIFRSDYMLNKEPEVLRQVEINAISVSFAGLAPAISELHHYVNNKVTSDIKHEQPKINTCDFVASSLIKAWEVYGKKEAIIVFIVEQRTFNICDQKAIEIQLFRKRPDILVKRKQFSDISKDCLDENNILRVDGKEVAVVYYRTGYVPVDYPDEKSWEARLLLERSKAIKCPSIKYQLAGVKKFQQILTDKNILKRFIRPEEGLDELYGTFAAIYHLSDTPEGNKSLEMGLKNPEKFVLKPQREGGGNNYYGSDIVTKLSEIRKSDERNAYILMELIDAVPVTNYGVDYKSSLKSRNFVKDTIISELGIFGSILADGEQVYCNEEGGYLLRSKRVNDTEAGIAAGAGFLDAPYLF
ncbi:glutathione synthetase [Tetranychus urticae]|uniref:Glutathione synthetase n=1 Tax=Tetranychus urticae TaxID=32264 RepID=T1L2V9_TETUR|nr:glutathione synthetase [Tetranychus urticae]